jgi:hypothetical protein
MNNELWNKLKLTGFLLALFFILYSLFTPSAFAESISLGIYPPIIQIDAAPPAEVSSDIVIQNQGEESIILKIDIKPFKPKGTENGELSFLFDNDEFGADPQMIERIKVYDEDNEINSVTLSPKQEKKLNLKISIPKGQTPSDYYFSIIFISENTFSSDLNLSQAAAGVAINVLLSVGPKEKPKGEIIEYSAPFFLQKGPVPFKVRLRNESDFFITPKGAIIIKNMFGQTIGRIDLLPVNILAHSTRVIPSTENLKELTANWNENFILGPYTATLIIALSEEGPLFKRDIYFIGFPIEVIIGIVIVIIIIVFITKRLRKKLKG